MFQQDLKTSLNLRKQSDGGTVGKAVEEFHAQNIYPVMCQRASWHY